AASAWSAGVPAGARFATAALYRAGAGGLGGCARAAPSMGSAPVDRNPVIEILTPAQLARARSTGALVAEILHTIADRAAPGTNLLEIDAWARQMIERAGAESCYVDYAPSFGRGTFGHFICTSVDDAVLHGRPRDQVLADGALLTLDLAVSLEGVVADAAISVVVGTPRPEATRLIEVTERALEAGIAAAGPRSRVGDVSAAIGKVLRKAGYPVNTQFGGHGVGSTMHQGPHIPNDGRRRK